MALDCIQIVMHSFQQVLQQVQQNPSLLSDSCAQTAIVPTSGVMPPMDKRAASSCTADDGRDDDLVLVGGPNGDCCLTPDQFAAQQQAATGTANGQAPVLLMLVPQQNLAQVLRNRAVAQNALVLDLASASPITVYE